MRRVQGFLAACAIYGVATVALFYRPGLVDGTAYFGNGFDPSLSIWMFRFLPQAAEHFQNLFILPQAWAPYGLNITQTTTTPFLALAAWPLTAALGPVVAFNLLTMAMPALAAASAFLFIAALTDKWAACVIGGWIFGFSTAIFGPLQGHLQTDFVIFIPLTFLILVLRLTARVSFGGCVIALSLAGICEFLTSLETYVTLSIFVVLFAAVAQGLKAGGWRSHLAPSKNNLLAPVVLAFAATAIAVSPYIYYFFHDYAELPHTLQNGGYYATDLSNFIIPTQVTWLGGDAALAISRHFAANPSEQLGYIGLPLLLITSVAAGRSWHIQIAKPVIVTMLIAAIFSLGPKLTISGHDKFRLPWIFLERLPLLGNALPSRLMIFVMLFIAVSCAIWLSRLQRFYGPACLLVMGAALMMLPASRGGDCQACWYSALPVAALSQTANLESSIPKGQTVLWIPFGPTNGDAMFWQSQNNADIRIVNGYGNFIPPEPGAWPAADILQTAAAIAPAEPAFIAAFDQFMKAAGARYVIVPAGYVTKWDGFLRAAGWTGRNTGATALYQIPDAAWRQITVPDVKTARLDFDVSHLTALGQAARCMLRVDAGHIQISNAIAAHCLDPAFAANPADRNANFDAMSGWLGDAGGMIGIGILADGREARAVLAALSDHDAKIFYPFPRLYNPARKRPVGRALLVLGYDPAGLIKDFDGQPAPLQ